MKLNLTAYFASALAGLMTVAAPGGAATVGTVPFPLGMYVGNPNGNSAPAMKDFKDGVDAHAAAVGAPSRFNNAFVDNSKDPTTWASAIGWAAWSSVQSGASYVAPAANVTPLVGIPLGWSGSGWANVDTFYLDTIAGKNDATWVGIVDAWADNGYKTVDFRIAYEMNGSYMAWAPGNSKAPAANSDFVYAFRHVVTVLRAEAAKRKMKIAIHWNPTAINWTAYDVTTLYPGSDYVDVIGIDQYSPMWPLGYTDWSTGGKTTMATPAAWAAIPDNRIHYWRYPNATQYVQTPTLHSVGWSIPQAMAFAKLVGRPISIDETGVGPSGNALGPADDPEFPKFLAGILVEAQTNGVAVHNVNIWDAWLNDGNWNFRDGSKPLTAAAWKRYFGPVTTVRPNPLKVGKANTVASTTLILGGGAVLSDWQSAFATGPVVVRVGGHTYNAISAATGSIVFDTPVAVEDAYLGAKVVPF